MRKDQLSVVIAICNEKSDGYLTKMVKLYPKNLLIEYIVVDCGTNSKLLESLKRNDFKFYHLPGSNRAERLIFGLKKAKHQLVLFHHPRSLVDSNGFKFLLDNQENFSWGGFTHRFDRQSFGLGWTSWYSNHIRPKIMRIVYLDHCIFFKKNCLAKVIPPVPIFEDTEICKILMRSGAPKILPFFSTTSAIRFETNGFLKQSLLNQVLKLGYYLRLSKKSMNKIYEKKIHLNE